ncbi:MAG: phospholipase D-like domain-containing protein [Polyangiaceae bacterium]
MREGGFKKLVILVARTEAIQGELKQAWKRRRDFVAKISSPDPSKVVVCQYKTKPGALVDLEQPRFVHSKTTIFDDRFVVIGSANCNRRGHTHDSECGIGVFDENPKADRLLFAHDLRIRLWMKHLDAASQNLRVRDFLDPIASARFWEQPSKNAPVELYDADGDTRKPPAAKNPGPDGRVTASAAGVGGFIGKGIDALLPLRLKNADDDWNILLDPDGA